MSELKHEGISPISILYYKDVGHSQEGAQEFVKLMGGGYFDGSKPVRLLRRLMTLANFDPDSIILDFFSGSATTAHAVMSLNAQDSGFRTSRVDSSNFRDVYQFLDDMAENIKHDRSDLDLLFMCAADFGLPLSLPYHTEIADGFTVHVYGENDIAACFGENISEEAVRFVAEIGAAHSVFRESCFDGACSRINMQQIFEAYSKGKLIIL